MPSGIYIHKPPSIETRQHIREALKKAYKEGRRIGGFKEGNKINLGRHHSEEVKEKIRLTKQGKSMWPNGRVFTLQHRLNMSQSRKGSIPWNKGKKLPEISGDKSHNWRGGKVSLIRHLRNSSTYSQWRLNIFKKDNFICTDCFKTNCYLEVHHCPLTFPKLLENLRITTYLEALFCKELWLIDKGKTLCKECHLKYRRINGF